MESFLMCIALERKDVCTLFIAIFRKLQHLRWMPKYMNKHQKDVEKRLAYDDMMMKSADIIKTDWTRMSTVSFIKN